MRHRPHSRWRSAIGLRWSRLVDRPRAFFKADRIDNAPGIGLTLRSFIPAPQVNPGCPGGSNPACRFMNVRPDVFYAGGSIANLVYSLQSIDQGTFIPTSGIGIYPVRKRTR
jgi:hypothetical protein